jgi:hypothetical protein
MRFKIDKGQKVLFDKLNLNKSNMERNRVRCKPEIASRMKSLANIHLFSNVHITCSPPIPLFRELGF